MKTNLIFNTEKLIGNLNSSSAFYKIKENKHNLKIIKEYKNKRGRPFSINIPKKIKISPEAAGLIVGEGFIGDRNFVFANSNEKAIDMVLNLLQQFNLPIKDYLEISIKNKDKKFINECKRFWEKQINTKIIKIRLRKEFNNITNHGTLHIGINNSLVAKLLKQIITKSKKKIEKNKELCIGYLKGILAAEGNINIKKKTNCVYMVRISASKIDERDHYKRCLKKIGINISCKDMPTVSKEEAKQKNWKTTKGRAGAVLISKWDNFIKILELNLLELSKEKEQKFMNHFFNNKFTKQFLGLRHFIDNDFTMKKIQNHFNFSGRHLNRVLTLWKKGYLERKLVKNHYIYKTNKRYLNIFYTLNSYQNNPIF
ncbi:MAG: hypothetical protein KKF56_00405 [Nanoarchaeota archaeon]|nr:hypothetical protein [Nanoarchaeota archaeon]